jgi:outer membrane protein
MIKKVVLFALLLIPMGAIAQETQKIAYFSPAEVIQIMPEYTKMQDSLQREQNSMENELKLLGEEYNKKYAAFMSESETLSETIKVRRLQDLKDLEERASTFNQQSQQLLEQLYRSLMAPIEEKIKNAITAVGAENNYAYILNAASLLYISPSSIDATPLIKTKLGIK